MNCRAAQSLLSAQPDRARASRERAGLEAHLAQCAGCRQTQSALQGALSTWRDFTVHAAVPDTERAWQDIHREIRRAPAPNPARADRRLGTWAISLGAAAAIALLVTLAPQPSSPSPASRAGLARAEAARADFVEVPSNASSLVYVDDRSGWLVVWVDDKRPAGL